MPSASAARGSWAILFGVYAAVVYDIISATNSSPQTTEINASVRAHTLMKWVNLGLLQAAGFVLLGAIAARSTAPIAGGGAAGILLWLQYRHARQKGLENGGAGTEVFGGYG